MASLAIASKEGPSMMDMLQIDFAYAAVSAKPPPGGLVDIHHHVVEDDRRGALGLSSRTIL